MPSPEHVTKNDKRRSGSAEEETTRRRGIALEVDQSGSYLSPSRLMANMGISNIREYLPNQSQSQSEMEGQGQGDSSIGVGEGYATTQEADLGDGHGRRPLLLISSPRHILQIFSSPPSRLPDDPHVKEHFSAPEEILSVPTLRYPSQAGKTMKDVKVESVRLIDRGGLKDEHGTVALLLLSRHGKGTSEFSLAILSIKSGEVVKKVDVGCGTAGSMSVSSRAIVIALTHPTPSLHFFHPTSLEPLRPCLWDLPSSTRSSLPIYAHSGRLLAYATSEMPLHPGKENLGSLVTASSTPVRARSQMDGHDHGNSHRDQTQNQNVILNSAVGIGGGVARGVWAGLKMGAQAASRATNGGIGIRMATSAPTHSHSPLEGGEDETESRSLDDPSVLDGGPIASSSSTESIRGKQGGEWIKIIDLVSPEGGIRTVAHFRLPPSRHLGSPPSTRNRRYSETHSSSSSAVAHLSFSPDGTTLFAAPMDGRSFHLFDIHPHLSSPASIKKETQVQGEVWHLYELKRGNTAAEVCTVGWSRDGRWIGVATGRGTVHVFAINPTGGPASSASHAPSTLANPQHLHPLSTPISPFARLRMRHQDPNQSTSKTKTAFTFQQQCHDPLRPGTSCLDLSIYRDRVHQVDLARLSISSTSVSRPTLQGDHAGPGRRGSGLTEMMKAKVGLVGADLDVSSKVMASWALPVGQEGVMLPTSKSLSKSQNRPMRNLAYAEIQTFSSNPHLLPCSIYLSHQIDFYASRPIDEYSRLSIMDKEARTRKLRYRPEVEIRPSLQSKDSGFDEPLINAIHSVIESSPSSELPHLPNGPTKYTSGLGSWKSSIPIQLHHVKEGVGHIRREYHYHRQKRRSPISSRGTANGDRERDSQGIALSFEDDVVLALAEGEDVEGGSDSSPASSGIPTTETEGDEEWGVRWEDEYNRAVEEDGGPDDLVLGLMDEQHEERRKWVERQKELGKEWGGRGGGGGGKRV